jgi:hypothetical protein
LESFVAVGVYDQVTQFVGVEGFGNRPSFACTCVTVQHQEQCIVAGQLSPFSKALYDRAASRVTLKWSLSGPQGLKEFGKTQGLAEVVQTDV